MSQDPADKVSNRAASSEYAEKRKLEDSPSESSGSKKPRRSDSFDDPGCSQSLDNPGKRRKSRKKDIEVDPAELKCVLDGMDDEIFDVLEESQMKNHLTAANVKQILRHVITNEYVLSMVRNTMKSENGNLNDLEEAVFEPKLTRSKAKELQKKQHVLPWPISTPIKQPEASTALLEAEFSDESSDEDYHPNEEECHSEEEVSILSPKSRDLESSLCEKASSPEPKAPDEDVEDEGELLIDAPELETEPFIEPMLGSTDADKIALRTRSKLPLNDTPLELIESSFIAPDITMDMYDTKCDDEEWLTFLKDLSQPIDVSEAVEKPDEEHDDGEDDPEYNVLEDEEDLHDDTDLHDDNDLQDDSTVQVLREELNALMAEIMESMQGEVNDVEEEEEEDAGSPENVRAPDIDENIEASACDEPPKLVEPDAPEIVSTKGNLPGSCPSKKRKSVVEESSSKPVASKLPPLSEWLTTEDRLQIAEQMRMYVQLLTQSYLLSYGVPKLSYISITSKLFLDEIKMFASESVTLNERSAFYPHNLDEALKIVNKYETGKIPIPARTPVKNKYMPPVIKSPYIKQTLFNSKVFMYPELLPVCGYYNSPELKRAFFSKAELRLVALGLEQFSCFEHPVDYIQTYLLPTKTVGQIKTHVKNHRNTKIPSSDPIKYFTLHKKVPPLPRIIQHFDPENVKAPRDMDPDFLPRWMLTMFDKPLYRPRSQTQKLPKTFISVSEQISGRKRKIGNRCPSPPPPAVRKLRPILPRITEDSPVPCLDKDDQADTILPDASLGTQENNVQETPILDSVEKRRLRPRRQHKDNQGNAILPDPSSSTPVKNIQMLPVLKNDNQAANNLPDPSSGTLEKNVQMSPLTNKDNQGSILPGPFAVTLEKNVQTPPVLTKDNEGNTILSDPLSVPPEKNVQIPLILNVDNQAKIILPDPSSGPLKKNVPIPQILSTGNPANIFLPYPSSGSLEKNVQMPPILNTDIQAKIIFPYTPLVIPFVPITVTNFTLPSYDMKYANENCDPSNPHIVNSTILPQLPNANMALMAPNVIGTTVPGNLPGSETHCEQTSIVLPKPTNKTALSKPKNNKFTIPPLKMVTRLAASHQPPAGRTGTAAGLANEVCGTLQRHERAFQHAIQAEKNGASSHELKQCTATTSALGTPTSEDATVSAIETQISEDAIHDFSLDKVKCEPEEVVDDPDNIGFAAEGLNTSTPKKAPGKKKSNVARNVQSSQVVLEPNTLENSIKKEEKETLVANSYLLRVTEALKNDPNTFDKFLIAISNFQRSIKSPIELFFEIKEILKAYPTLVEDFVIFLKPEQAQQCGKYKEYIILRRLREFMQKVEVHFEKEPQQLLKILKMLSHVKQQPNISSAEILSTLQPLLENQSDLMEELQALLPDAAPPESLMTHCIDAPHLKIEDADASIDDDSDSSEEYFPPNEPYGGKRCPCICHAKTYKAKYVKRLEHCVKCRMKASQTKQQSSSLLRAPSPDVIPPSPNHLQDADEDIKFSTLLSTSPQIDQTKITKTKPKMPTRSQDKSAANRPSKSNVSKAFLVSQENQPSTSSLLTSSPNPISSTPNFLSDVDEDIKFSTTLRSMLNESDPRKCRTKSHNNTSGKSSVAAKRAVWSGEDDKVIIQSIIKFGASDETFKSSASTLQRPVEEVRERFRTILSNLSKEMMKS